MVALVWPRHAEYLVFVNVLVTRLQTFTFGQVVKLDLLYACELPDGDVCVLVERATEWVHALLVSCSEHRGVETFTLVDDRRLVAEAPTELLRIPTTRNHYVSIRLDTMEAIHLTSFVC